MKKLRFRRKAAVYGLILLFLMHAAWTVYGEEFSGEHPDMILGEPEENMEFSREEHGQEDIFTDGPEKDEGSLPNEGQEDEANAEPEAPGLPSVSGGYSSFGGGNAPGETVIRKPQLFLSSTSLDDSAIRAGTESPFTAAFVNKSGKQSIYNLKITLSADNGNLNFSSNSFYFAKISPGQEIQIHTTIKTVPDTTETTVPITFDFEYEDIKGTSAAGTEKKSISVSHPIEMELFAGEIPTCLFAADSTEFTLGALNLSRTTVYNVRISLKGAGLFPQEEIFIGNMEPGTKEEGTMRVYAGAKNTKDIGADNGGTDNEKYGPIKGKIILKYEDYQGNPGRITQKFRTEIKKPRILSLNVNEETKEKNSWWISVFIVGILGLISVVFILLWKLRRKNVLLEEARKEGFYEKI